MELPKIPSVVGCKDDLQEGERPSDDLRGYGVDLWNYLKFLVYLDARMIFKKAEGIPMVEEVMV